MQGIERTIAEPGSVPAGQVGADVKREIWKGTRDPHPIRPVSIEVHIQLLRFTTRQILSEHVLLDRVGPLSKV